MSKIKDKKFNELRSVRAKLGITQEEIGKSIGVSASTYSQKENGNMSIYLDESLEILVYINKLLSKKGYEETTIEELFLRK